MKKTAFLLFLLAATLFSVSAANLFETGGPGRGNEPGSAPANGSGSGSNTVPVMVIYTEDPIIIPATPINPDEIPFDYSPGFNGNPSLGGDGWNGGIYVCCSGRTIRISFSDNYVPNTVMLVHRNTGEFWSYLGEPLLCHYTYDTSGDWDIYVWTTSGTCYHGSFQVMPSGRIPEFAPPIN